MFISDDLPTLLLPINAYSGSNPFGHLATSELLITNSADLICMEKVFLIPSKEEISLIESDCLSIDAFFGFFELEFGILKL